MAPEKLREEDIAIGQRIKNRRIEIGMTQEELAQRVGYAHKSSINKIELGERSLMQSKIKPIADALDTTPDYTFSRNWKKIPAGIKEKCSAAELAEMVDVLYEQYKKED